MKAPDNRDRINIVGQDKGSGLFPDGNSALMLACARLRHVSSSAWGAKRYMNMDRLYDMEREHAVQIG